MFHTKDVSGNEDFSDDLIICDTSQITITQLNFHENILEQNSKNNYLTTFKLQAPERDITLSGLVLNAYGTGTSKDIESPV